LTFDLAIKNGKLTEKEVQDYKEKVIKSNCSFDQNVSVNETFLHTDILISDYSSILMSFFITGKPIIYCADTNIALYDIYREMVDSFYVAKSWVDVLDYVKMLVSGNDPLNKKRAEVINKIEQKYKGSVENILNYMI
jgi:CDP-glycerol glycerophosphotransferase (TagB/SpsB family)